MHIINFKPLNEEQNREVVEWLREKNADSPKVRRTLSDVYPFAMLLLDDFPRQLDLLNYPKRSRIALKAENWLAFNFKFLSRHNLSLGKEFIEDLAKGTQGAIEILIYEMIRLRKQQLRKLAKRQERITAAAQFESSELDQDQNEEEANANANANGNTMKQNDMDINNIVQVTSRMILFTRYEEISRECQAKDEMIRMYEQRVKNLERACKSFREELHQMSMVISTLPEATQALFKPVKYPLNGRGPQQ